MTTSLISRRGVLALLLPGAGNSRELPTREWLIGRWRANGERTAATLSIQGILLTPEQRKRAELEFDKMFYLFSERTFTVGGWVPGQSQTFAYRVVSETRSSITLEFPRTADMPPLTLYRESDEWLFVRTGNRNIEYLKRASSNA